jgi:hypothetical protein
VRFSRCDNQVVEDIAVAPRRHERVALAVGAAFGVVVVVSPLAVWWLDAATIHCLIIAFIPGAYVGFAVADGRSKVIAVESAVAGLFLLLAAVAVTGSAWLLVIGYLGHGCKDLWQHRTGFVTGTRWWAPFCGAVDVVAAVLIAALILGSVQLDAP